MQKFIHCIRIISTCSDLPSIAVAVFSFQFSLFILFCMLCYKEKTIEAKRNSNKIVAGENKIFHVNRLPQIPSIILSE